MSHADIADVLAAVRDVTYPADKDALLAAARSAGASDEVLAALRAVPPVEYANRDEVARSARADPTADLGLTAAQQAEQAREGGRPGQSQHLRDVPKPPVQEELDRDR